VESLIRRILLITHNDLRQTLSDRALLLLMFLAPLAVATIISVTFGSLADESAPIENIPIAIANLDRGSPVADFGEQYGAVLGAVTLAVSAGADDLSAALAAPREPGGDDAGLTGLIRAVEVRDEELARAWLEDGTVSAVVVLPADLSRRLTGPAGRGAAEVRVLTRPDRSISADIVLNITQGLLDGFSSALSVTQAVVSSVSVTEGVPAPSVLGRPGIQRSLSADQAPPATLVALEVDSRRAGGIGFNPLVAFGATQAIFFALFTANANASSIMEEERDGTFIRLLASPTRKLTLLAGKLVSTVVMVIVQLVLLFLAFTIIGSLLEGEMVFIWGTQIGRIIIVIILTAFAASGIGAVVASSAKTPEQAGVIGMVINMFMAVTGGAFGFRFNSGIRYASVVHWGSNAFEELAAGGSDILANVAVLGGFGVAAFLVASLLLQRRFDR
jgi:ABC-2 type transport system permease protein